MATEETVGTGRRAPQSPLAPPRRAAQAGRGASTERGPVPSPASSAIRAEVRLIGKHSLVYLAGQALSRAVGFFMIPVYTHYISPASYGANDLIEILCAIVALTLSMGVADTMSRFYYRASSAAERNAIVSTVIIGFGVLGIPIAGIFLASSTVLADVLIGNREYAYYLQVSIAATWFGMLCEIAYTYLRMRYMAKLFVAVTIAQLFLALSLNIWFVVFLRWDIFGIIVSTLITQGLVGLGLAIAILMRVGVRVSPSHFVRLIRFSLPLVPTRITQFLGFASNRLFLRWLGPADPAVALAQIGLFSLGHRFALIVNRFVNSPFNSFWGPRRFEILASGDPGARETIARICTYATALSTFAVLGVCAGVESVIRVMADPAYYGAHQVVPFIALAYIGVGLEPHLSTGMLHHGKTTWLTAVSLISVAVCVAWNCLMIPRWGLLGAATANCAAILVREVLIYSLSQRVYPIPFEIRRLVILHLVAAMLYLLAQKVTLASPYCEFLARMGLVLMFPAVLLFVGFYTPGEIGALRRLLAHPRLALLGAADRARM